MATVRPTEELKFTHNGNSYEGKIEYASKTGQVIVKVKGLFGSTIGTATIVNARGEITPWGKERLSESEQNNFLRITKESILKTLERSLLKLKELILKKDNHGLIQQ